MLLSLRENHKAVSWHFSLAIAKRNETKNRIWRWAKEQKKMHKVDVWDAHKFEAQALNFLPMCVSVFVSWLIFVHLAYASYGIRRAKWTKKAPRNVHCTCTVEVCRTDKQRQCVRETRKEPKKVNWISDSNATRQRRKEEDPKYRLLLLQIKNIFRM